MTVDELSEVAARLAALRQGFPDRLPPEVVMFDPADTDGLTVLEHLDDEWTAKYRVRRLPNEALAVIGVAIEPSGEPSSGISTRTARLLRPAAALAVAQQWIDDPARRPGQKAMLRNYNLLLPEGPVAAGDTGFHQVIVEMVGPRRSGGHSDEFFVELASRFVALRDGGTKNPTGELTSELARQGVERSVARVRALLGEARTRGILTPAAPGKADGNLTQHAREVAARMESDRAEMRRRREWVWIDRPGARRMRVTRSAYEDVWAHRGWSAVMETHADVALLAAELGALLRLGLKAADRDRDQPITPAAGGAA